MSGLHPDLIGAKATTKALVEANGGSEACSVILGKSASLIRSYGNQNVPDRFMPLDDVIALERTAGRPVVSTWMVERAKADPDRPRRRACISDLARWIKEGSEAKIAYAALFADPSKPASLADRQTAARELREIHALIGDLIDAVEGGE